MKKPISKTPSARRVWFFMTPDMEYRFKKRLMLDRKDEKRHITQQDKLTEIVAEYAKG